MECNKDEALRAKALAERKMEEGDFVAARKFINKAQQLSSKVDNIAQLLALCDVYCAAGTKVNGETDWYGILQVPVFTNDDTLIKKQYRKLAFLLHPDKNKFAGAEAAFKLLGEANRTLTDSSERAVYDMKRRGPAIVATARPYPYEPKPSAGPGTFWTSCSNHNATVNTKSGKSSEYSRRSSPQKQGVIVIEESDDEDKSSEYSRRSSWQKQEVIDIKSDDEDVGDDGNEHDDNTVNSSNFKRLRKDGMFHSDNQSNETMLNGDKTEQNGLANGLNNEKIYNSVSSNGLDPNLDASDVIIYCVDPQFFKFDQLRDVTQFRADQIWALYDSQGCMPRFYARIKEVKKAPEFIVHLTWLQFNPTNTAEEVWSREEVPVAFGHFKFGESETVKEVNKFSHTMYYVEDKTRGTLEMYPRKDEVWALFKGSDIKGLDIDWRSYEYEVVKVVSDFMEVTIIVMPLVKIKGFVSLFMQSKEATPYDIPWDKLRRFSHLVPSHMMSGTEKEGIPEGALELDPAALPENFEEAFASVVPESSSGKGQEFDTKCAGSSSGNVSAKGSTRVGGCKPGM